MEKKVFELVRNSIFRCIVCSTESAEEAEAWVRATCPAGTEDNWRYCAERDDAVLQCSEHPERKHYLFAC